MAAPDLTDAQAQIVDLLMPYTLAASGGTSVCGVGQGSPTIQRGAGGRDELIIPYTVSLPADTALTLAPDQIVVISGGLFGTGRRFRIVGPKASNLTLSIKYNALEVR